MRPFVIAIFIVLFGFLLSAACHAGTCNGNSCTIDVPVSYDVQPASRPLVGAAVGAGRVSVKVAAVPAKLAVRAAKLPIKAVARLGHAIRERERKPAQRLVGRLLHR